MKILNTDDLHQVRVRKEMFDVFNQIYLQTNEKLHWLMMELMEIRIKRTYRQVWRIIRIQVVTNIKNYENTYG
jgi:BMFP domain-containing protein YqiC